MDGRKLPPLGEPQPFWHGYSVGQWEGDTLVVESNNFRGVDPDAVRTSEPSSFHGVGWLDHRGTPYTEAMKVTERFRRVNYGQLDIEFTVDDPKAYTKPFTIRVVQQIVPDGSELIEFICHENQMFLKLTGRERRYTTITKPRRPRGSPDARLSRGSSRVPIGNHRSRQGRRRVAGAPANIWTRRSRRSRRRRKRFRCSSSRAEEHSPTPFVTSIAGSACQMRPRIGWRCWPWISTRTSSPLDCRTRGWSSDWNDAAAALEDGRIPVLAPYQWLREADPLPHSWDVTSDSISAWVAGQIGAARLRAREACQVLPGPAIVDPCFERFLPAHIKAEIVAADRIDELSAMLRRV